MILVLRVSNEMIILSANIAWHNVSSPNVAHVLVAHKIHVAALATKHKLGQGDGQINGLTDGGAPECYVSLNAKGSREHAPDMPSVSSQRLHVARGRIALVQVDICPNAR